MAEFRVTVQNRQRQTHWACYPHFLTPCTNPFRSLTECIHAANETGINATSLTSRKRGGMNPADTILKRKKRMVMKAGHLLQEENEEADDEEANGKKSKAKLSRIINEWANMDFLKATPKQWTALKQAAENHGGIRKKLEEVGVRKLWTMMLKKDLTRGYKSMQTMTKRQTQDRRRLADLCRKEVRNEVARNEREFVKSTQSVKKLVREMLTFWKKIDRQNADLKKQEEKAAAEQQKREDELRERKRQTQRLNFLLSQTELYTHFMSDKLGLVSQDQSSIRAVQDIDESMWIEVKHRAENAVALTFDRVRKFDDEYKEAQMRSVHVPSPRTDSLMNPSSMPESSSVQQPSGFKGVLKSYQLRGLQWLVNLYEQGLNGILADEMGLGKTIQAIAFMGHLAEEKSIWGPYLIVAPASTLHNWDHELRQFYPELKVLPYWGHCSDRRILRQCFNPKKLYNFNSPFHVAVTSYQILVQDEAYLKRVKWQYLILDEAQAIKSSHSVRWKTLLSFSCRNRILLTGTPIQNNLAELWALLHFIMPTLFDSMEQFSEWFSKDLENFVEGSQELNKEQLKRLHSILSPFMLRRVKSDVASELVSKIEHIVYCDLSHRQQDLYHAIQQNLNLSDLFDNDDKKVVNLMNLVVQLRKVCNHPELFEEQTEKVPLQFARIPEPLNPPSFGSRQEVYFTGAESLISYSIPRLVIEEGTTGGKSGHLSGAYKNGYYIKWLDSLLDIFDPWNVHNSESVGSLLSLLGLCPREAQFLSQSSSLERWIMNRTKTRNALICVLDLNADLDQFNPPLVMDWNRRLQSNISLLNAVKEGYVEAVLAPPISLYCTSPCQPMTTSPLDWIHHVLFGTRDRIQRAHSKSGLDSAVEEYRSCKELPLMWPFFRIFGSSPPAQMYALAKSLVDSGKMLKLDELLKKLKAGNHRVLLFSQMTMMMNILEDYLSFRRYKYLRLDGQSMISDRRDMVHHFQSNPEIFVFLLSTRAGGLGINLTAADTVIFYESDWNPTMDLQAMDRAHRLGQTKDVSVYRFVCRDTIEENIIRRAREKETVQQLVMTGQMKEMADVFAPEDVVSMLLNNKDQQQLAQKRSGLLKRWPGDRKKTKILLKGESIEISHDASIEERNTEANDRRKRNRRQ
eukprot:g5201.t1